MRSATPARSERPFTEEQWNAYAKNADFLGKSPQTFGLVEHWHFHHCRRQAIRSVSLCFSMRLHLAYQERSMGVPLCAKPLDAYFCTAQKNTDASVEECMTHSTCSNACDPACRAKVSSLVLSVLAKAEPKCASFQPLGWAPPPSSLTCVSCAAPLSQGSRGCHGPGFHRAAVSGCGSPLACGRRF